MMSEVKPRMSVNNKDIIRMYLGYNWLITLKSLAYYPKESTNQCFLYEQ